MIIHQEAWEILPSMTNQHILTLQSYNKSIKKVSIFHIVSTYKVNFNPQFRRKECGFLISYGNLLMRHSE
ncbi:hypothetical protein EUGRSUZ_D01465 [Eucalyptus grandis]|uniref:Uncharacterized protein n=2 Tax=Eucalyptus grandis TaxID=71139 RepID=A0ACC3L6E8_EUCGR|nr:hypothetical protein EUGRSUZ_D01465 [Eucalyptus grandis]